MRTTTLTTALTTSAILALALTGCSAPAASGDDASGTSPSASAAAATAGITISDAWVKAAASGMSAAFGTFRNGSGQDVTIVSAESPASSTVQLHENVPDDKGGMVMRPREGGFTIPAGGSLDLAPGADHLMLMGLTSPLAAGDQVHFTVHLADGSTYDFSAPVKDYAGADENYQGGDAGTGMGQ